MVNKEGVCNMNTIDELLYYSKEVEPVGALLLTGEWGCGKTHLIDNDFREAISPEAVVLRISLFSMTSPEEIHAAVKNAWLSEYSKVKGMEKVAQKISAGKEITSKLDFLPEWVRGIASTDVSVFIPIGNTIDDKKVILVFDDLERCRINIVDVLGIINEYCENQKYHTIIVANQEKIQTKEEPIKMVTDIPSVPNQTNQKIILDIQGLDKCEKNNIPYAEIKEKIIQRTVHYIPDYEAIVHMVVKKMKYPTEEYKDFVASCEETLLDLFAPDRNISKHQEVTPSRPHNIRSLKCAISDFYRVYCILKTNDFSNISTWFYSFVSYVIAYKADIAKEGKYGTLFTDNEVKKLYPGFQNNYIFDCVKMWILRGTWNSKTLLHEVEFIKEQERARTPSEIIKTYRVTDVDEEIICNGFTDFLNLAYEGRLSLDEYVLLICNSSWARSIDYVYPTPIVWSKINCGISIQIEKMKVELPEGQILYKIISDENKPNFTADEWGAYTLISTFALGNEFMFYKNRNLYVEKMHEYRSSAFQFIQNKRFDVFDEVMATTTAAVFFQENNAEKRYFAQAFKQLWTGNLRSSDMQIQESLEGFRQLKGMLTDRLGDLDEKNKHIAKTHTIQFIQSIEEMINENEYN